VFDHDRLGIVDNCQSCHDNVIAIGKAAKPDHVVTNQDCGVCHTTTTFIGAGFDHTGIVDNCARSGCHGSGAIGKDAKTNPAHLQTNLDCSACHTTATFKGGGWVHDSSTAGNCKTCHKPNGDATPQPNGHFTTTEQCDVCHTTNAWVPTLKYKHSANGDYPGDHRRTLACRSCHTTNNETIPYPSKNTALWGFCAGCHDNKYRTGDHGGRSVTQNKDCGRSGCHRVNANGW
jgi:hypothetical protein